MAFAIERDADAQSGVLQTITANLEQFGTISVIAQQDDGKIIVAGSFTSINGYPRDKLARLNPDGSVDLSWTNGMGTNIINALAVKGSNVFVGGTFTNIGAYARNNIAKLNYADGSVDPTFTNGANATVNALAFDGTNLFAGGQFTSIGGRVRGRIAKLDIVNGIADPGFSNSVGNVVNTLALEGTNLFIGGVFTNIGVYARSNIAKLNVIDGSVDMAFIFGPSNNVNTLALEGTNLFAGGMFTNIGGLGRSYIAKLNFTDGSANSVFVNGASNNVLALALKGTNLFAAGIFTGIGGQMRYRIAKLNIATGVANMIFTNGADAAVNALAFDGTNLFVGGGFNNVGYVPAIALAQIDMNTGAKVVAFDPVVADQGSAVAYSLAVQNDKKVIIGGNFTVVNGQIRRNIARLNADGTLDPSFTNGANLMVKAMAVQGTNLFVGGNFTNIGGQVRNYIAKLSIADGSVDLVFSNGANTFVNALAVEGTNLFAGGAFVNIGGQARDRIAKLNMADGLADPAFVTSSSNIIYALALEGTNLFVGGMFTNIGGQVRDRIAKLNIMDGSVDMVFTNGASNVVNTLALKGTNLFAGGTFNYIGGQFRSRIAKLNIDSGLVDPAFSNGANNNVNSLALDGPNLVVGGAFTNIGGQARNYLAKMNAMNSTVIMAFTNTSDNIISEVALDGTNLYLGGQFSTVDGRVRRGFAAIGLQYSLQSPPGVSASDGLFIDRVSLTWNTVSDATGYQVWRNTNADVGTALQLDVSSVGGYNDTSAVPGTVYFYWVRATNDNVMSMFSSPDAGFRLAAPPAPTTVNASDGLFVDRIRVGWNPIGNATGYQVYRNTLNDSGSAGMISTVGTNVYDDTDLVLVPGSLYYYWVKATNLAGASGFSVVDAGYRSGLPSAPVNVNASQGTYTGMVYVSWQTATNATGYIIARSITNSVLSAVPIGTATNIAFWDTAVSTGIVYYYWIKATNTAVESAFSAASARGWCFQRQFGGLMIDVTPTSGCWFITTAPSDYPFNRSGTNDLGPVTVPTGLYAVQFGALTGYSTPSGLTRNIGPGSNVVFTGYYVPFDSDGDGLLDVDEINIYHTNPNNPDTDGDLCWDGVEVAAGTDPLDPGSYPMGTLTFLEPASGDVVKWNKQMYITWTNTTPTGGVADVYLSSGTNSWRLASGVSCSDAKVTLVGPLSTQTITGVSWLAGTNFHINVGATGGVLYGNSDRFTIGRECVEDFDGDGKSDVWLYFKPWGLWYVGRSTKGPWYQQFGWNATDPVVGDFDGDCRTDIGVYYPPSGTWYLLMTKWGYQKYQLGDGTMTPVVGDYTGDGKDDLAVYQASTRMWYFRSMRDGAVTGTVYGVEGTMQMPVVLDYDGDGRDDLGVYVPSNGMWFVYRSSMGQYQQQFGGPGSTPIPGDYDGDGRDDLAVYEHVSGIWHFLTARGYGTNQFGWNGPMPIRGDYDGDGVTDIGVFDGINGAWHLLESTKGYVTNIVIQSN